MVLNLGLSGVPLTGADVGGFARGPGKYGAIKPLRPSAELFLRWMELGALMPFFRVHCTLHAPGQEPWSFGRRALKLARTVLKRRYRLLPLLYRLALDAHTEGLPIVRPLHMHFDVPDGVGKDQFLLGEQVLVAPVLDKGLTQRTVWLPEGSWTEWNSGAVLAGGRDHVVDAPLGTTPLFVQAGAPLFLAEPARNAMDTLRMPLALEVSPPPPGIVRRGSLFLDDGESARSARFVSKVSVECLRGQLAVRFRRLTSTFQPVQSHFELRAPLDFSSALVDGERRDLTFRNLAHEDRRAVMMALRAPLDVQEIILRRD
jgi:alpha-glucosidase